MNLYFAGGSNETQLEFMRKNNCNQLLSQLNERTKIIEWVEYLREHPECSSKLFIDSGAWTAYTKRKTIDTDDYINFINDYGDKVTIFASIDKIPGEYGRDPTNEELLNAPKESWENYLYMWERIKYKDKLIPVFHYGESFEHLKSIIEYTHTDGSKVTYIGLGGVADLKDYDERKKWLTDCYRVIKESKNPDVQAHAFGMTSTDLLQEFPFTSADSTTWLKAATYGELIILNKDGSSCRVKISERTASKQGAFHTLPSGVKAVVKDVCAKFNMCVSELETDAEKRLLFNMLSMHDYMMNNYTCKYVYTEQKEPEEELLFDF